MSAEHAPAATLALSVTVTGAAATLAAATPRITKGASPVVPVVPVVPSVSAVVEMNLEEYPAFRLGRRSKRPELRYTRSRTDAAGRTIEQLWVVRGAEGLGLPGPFEQDLYVALLVLFTEQGLPTDGRIRFTRNRLAQLMDVSNSGRGYELIEQGLRRLAGATIQTEHAFYRPLPMDGDGKRSGPTERLSLTFHILEEVRVYERRAAALEAAVWEPDDSDGEVVVRPRVEVGRPFEVSVARLGQPLVQSYERRYTKHLDTTFYFTLTRPLAKRLYRYVDKVRNGRGSFEIGLRPLADVLGLEYRYPSDIKDGLAEAHAELREHGYLLSSDYAPLAGGPGAGEKVVYAFDPAFDQRPRRRAGAAPAALPDTAEGDSPPQLRAVVESKATPGHRHAERSEASVAVPALPAPASERGCFAALGMTEGDSVAARARTTALRDELESFGISPKRAAALVEAFPEAHVAARIAHVRTLLDGKGKRTLRNPAGYLARAIEDGYTVPVAAAPRAAGEASREPQGADGHREATPVPAPTPQADAMQPAETPPPAAPEPEGLWGELAAALRDRLSGAAYAAWVAPIQAREDAEQGRALTLVVPSAFALDRWHRPPIAPALAEAAAALGIMVRLDVAAGSSAIPSSHGAPR
jgi:hypothetical protein